MICDKIVESGCHRNCATNFSIIGWYSKNTDVNSILFISLCVCVFFSSSERSFYHSCIHIILLKLSFFLFIFFPSCFHLNLFLILVSAWVLAHQIQELFSFIKWMQSKTGLDYYVSINKIRTKYTLYIGYVSNAYESGIIHWQLNVSIRFVRTVSWLAGFLASIWKNQCIWINNSNSLCSLILPLYSLLWLCVCMYICVHLDRSFASRYFLFQAKINGNNVCYFHNYFLVPKMLTLLSVSFLLTNPKFNVLCIFQSNVKLWNGMHSIAFYWFDFNGIFQSIKIINSNNITGKKLRI